MSRVKKPIEKKRHSLHRDHRVFPLEGNKTFRKAWRLKKVKASRQLRRAQSKELLKGGGPDEGQAPGPKPMRTLKKLGIISLSQAIAFKEGKFGSRWDSKVLSKNKEALRATKQRARMPRCPR